MNEETIYRWFYKNNSSADFAKFFFNFFMKVPGDAQLCGIDTVLQPKACKFQGGEGGAFIWFNLVLPKRNVIINLLN